MFVDQAHECERGYDLWASESDYLNTDISVESCKQYQLIHWNIQFSQVTLVWWDSEGQETNDNFKEYDVIGIMAPLESCDIDKTTTYKQCQTNDSEGRPDFIYQVFFKLYVDTVFVATFNLYKVLTRINWFQPFWFPNDPIDYSDNIANRVDQPGTSL